jgi:hypothetical protein
MLFIHWLSRTVQRQNSPRSSRRERALERRLKLMRLESRRVLNADFTFAANLLKLDNVDGDLTIREVTSDNGSQVEFDLTGSVWQNDASTGLFAIDNSQPGHSILSIAKSDMESLASGVSLHAAASDFDLQFDVQSSTLDLSTMSGALVAEGFGRIDQAASPGYEMRLGDVSLSADHISLSQFHGEDITLHANEIDFMGGEHSVSGSTLSILSATTPTIELGGASDDAGELNFTDTDIAALDATFHRISFEAGSSEANSSLIVDAAGADFQDALASGPASSLHLQADSVQIDGELSLSGGLIEVTASDDATITDTGSLVSHGGQVRVDGGDTGTLLVSGDIDVSNTEPGGIGGTVHLFGEQVGLFGEAEVDASGYAGGGEVLIGGGLHGDDDAIPRSDHAYVGHDVEIHADATYLGDGGTVVVWSDEVTQVYGSLTARGGALLGDGGLIETSSHEQLIATRGGDASAANGQAGTWLLDPLNVRIVAVPSAVFLVTEFNTPPFFTPSVSGSEVTDEAIEDQLAMGTTVVISTFNPSETEAGDVTQVASIDVTFVNAGDSATFVVSAANDIFINAAITATNGSLNVVLEANTGSDDGNLTAGNVTVAANIGTNGGFFSSTGVDFTSTGRTITATGGVSVTHSGTVNLGALNTDSGAGFGGTTFINGATLDGVIDVGEGDVFVDGGNPDLIVNAAITTTDTAFLLADRDVIVRATIAIGVGNPTADLSITGNADASADGLGGFLLDEDGDAQIEAGGNISIVGAALVATADPDDSLVIETDGANPQIIAGQDLTLVANFGSLSSAGNIQLDGVMSATGGSLTAFFTGTTFLGADQFAGTDMLFQNAVQLTQNVTLMAGNDLTLASSMDDDGVGLASALTVIADGNALFVGAIGNAAPLATLTVTGEALIDFLDSVRTDGNLTVNANSETDRITFQGAVTTLTGNVAINNNGLLFIGSNADFTVAGSFKQSSPNGTGSTELGADITTTNDVVEFNQDLLLIEDQIAINSNDHDITFGGTIDSEVPDEVQTITLANATGGTFTITVGIVGPAANRTTAPIAFDATAADVQAALVALLALADDDVVVSGGAGGPYRLDFQGGLRGREVPQFTASEAGLTGAAPTITVATLLDGGPEHNAITLTAGTGTITFGGDIGALPEGDHTLGNFLIETAAMVVFNQVETVATFGLMDFGSGSVIAGGIDINGVNPIAFVSQANIRVNGGVTSGVDLSLAAAGDVELTADGDITTTGGSVTILADANGDRTGDLLMNDGTEIDAGNGFIDVQAVEVNLGLLTTMSTNPTDADHPAIRVVATFGAINDFNGPALNLSATNRSVDQEPGAGVVLDAVLGIGSDDALETAIASLSAFNHDQPERQLVTLTNATGGNFALRWNPPGVAPEAKTNPIPFNASADVVKAALLQTFTTLSAKDLEVSGEPGGPYLITFVGAFEATNVAAITAEDVDLTGVDAAVDAQTVADFNRADNNIVIADNGTADAGRLDLIFVHNEANQIEQQFAAAVVDFTTHPRTATGTPSTTVTTSTEITFSAAVPGESGNSVVLNFTSSDHRVEDLDGDGVLDAGEDLNGNGRIDDPAIGVPIITVTGSTITIDLDSDGTSAFAVRDAINSHHEANRLVRATITATDPLSDPKAPGADLITDLPANPNPTLSGAGAEDGVIDIRTDGDLRVVADNSRPVMAEMQAGIDSFNPPDLAVAAIQSENTIKLTAETIEVFDDILAIQPLTQITADLNTTTTTIGVVDLNVFPTVDGDPSSVDFFIQIASKFDPNLNPQPDPEVLAVIDIQEDGNLLIVRRGQSGTTAAEHVAGTVIANIGVDNGIRQFIEITAGANFVLGEGRVISTDDHYINSLNLLEDFNGNGLLDAAEDFDDANGNGRFDPAEPFIDANNNGQFDLGEPFYDLDGDMVFTPSESFTDTGGIRKNNKYDASPAFDDANGNGMLDAGESFFGEDGNGDNKLQFNYGEDANRNGLLDAGEDLNGDGILQLRGNKPATAANDDFLSPTATAVSPVGYDVVRITVDQDFSGAPEGRVLLGENSTISTDNGIEQRIAPRPVLTLESGVSIYNLKPEFFTGEIAFFSGTIKVSELQSRILDKDETLPDGRVLADGSFVFDATLEFTIGVPGEKNLILEIDWGDHDRTQASPIPPITDSVQAPKFNPATGVYVFDNRLDQHATRFLIPEGGAKYSIPHAFPQSALTLEDLNGQPINTPGRTDPSNPALVRFAVSQHPSIVIDAQSVLDPRVSPDDLTTAAVADVPVNALFDREETERPAANQPSTLPSGTGENFPYSKTDPALSETGSTSARLFRISGTDVSDDTDLFLPRFDNGVAKFTVPTAPTVPLLPSNAAISPPDLPRAFVPDNSIITAPLSTTESSRSSAVSATLATEEYFELQRANEDGTTTVQRLTKEQSDALLKTELFQEFVRELGDGDYEILFVTRETAGSGGLIKRTVIEFRLESGRIAPPANDLPTKFKPYRLIPVPKVLKPDQPNNDGADDNSKKPDDNDAQAAAVLPDNLDLPPANARGPSSVEPSPLGLSDDAAALKLDSANDQSDSTAASSQEESDLRMAEPLLPSDPSHTPDLPMPGRSFSAWPLAVGAIVVTSTRWRQSRFKQFGTSLFSKTARLSRKRFAPKDDQ